MYLKLPIFLWLLSSRLLLTGLDGRVADSLSTGTGLEGADSSLIVVKEKNSGFEGKLEGGFYTGLLINLNFVVYNSGFGANVMGGYRVNDYFVLYGGAGLERLEDGVLIPFFLDFETYFSPKKKGYLDARIGYSTGFNNRSINIDYQYRGGFLFGFGIGRDLYASDRFRLGFNFSYNYRQAQYSYVPFDESERLTSKFDYHFLSGRIAFSFK